MLIDSKSAKALNLKLESVMMLRATPAARSMPEPEYETDELLPAIHA